MKKKFKKLNLLLSKKKKNKLAIILSMNNKLQH